jgi:ankyrin repeat protein
MLVERGCDVNRVTPDGFHFSFCHICVRVYAIFSSSFVIGAGATALMLASKRGHRDVVEFLLDNGADATIEMVFSSLPLTLNPTATALMLLFINSR